MDVWPDESRVVVLGDSLLKGQCVRRMRMVGCCHLSQQCVVTGRDAGVAETR